MKVDYEKIPLIFNVYKPVGISSFSVVHHFKKNLNYHFGKIGHFGTLDPFAEGILMVGVQGAQRLNEYIHELLPKTYIATGLFGKKMDTGDHTGVVVSEEEISPEFQKYTCEQLESLYRDQFLGEYWQAPHSVSATKFEGKRLYEHALSGRMITKEKVKREILDFKILSFNYPELSFMVTVSSGTYVRSLFEEMALMLKGVGYLQKLVRSYVGENSSEYSLLPESWPVRGLDFDLEKWGTPLDLALRLNKLILTDAQTYKYLQGRRLNVDEVECLDDSEGMGIASNNIFWAYNSTGHLLGLAKYIEGQYQVVFNLRLAIDQFLILK